MMEGKVYDVQVKSLYTSQKSALIQDYTSNTQTTSIFKFQRRHSNPHEGVQACSFRLLLLPSSGYFRIGRSSSYAMAQTLVKR